MSHDLSRLQSLLERGLEETAPLWPAVRVGYRWVHQAAHILGNENQLEETAVKHRLGGWLGAMTRHQAAARSGRGACAD